MTKPQHLIIESIEPKSWSVRLRDSADEQVHEIELRGDGPWQLKIDGSPSVAAAPPPDTAITLKLDNQREPGLVRVSAVGKGAFPWAEAQASLLGVSWQNDGKGPALDLPDSATLVTDIQKVLPGVTLDLTDYQGPWRASALETKGAKTKAAPSSEAITLHLVSTPNGVRVAARGRGAIAWSEQQQTLLGVKWFKDDRGAPALYLDDRMTLVDEIQTALPGVKLNLGKYEPREVVAEARQAEETAVEPPAPDVAENRVTVPGPAPKKGGRGFAGKSEDATARRRKAAPPDGPGPGGLVWTSTVDDGAEGLAARWGQGQFKLLHVGADRYGLFYELDGGGFETIHCGSLDDMKSVAGERASGTRPPSTLDPRLAQLACAAAPKTGRPSNGEITLHLRRSESAQAVLVIRATGERVHEWVFHHKSVLGKEWNRGDDYMPEIHIHDKPTIVGDLREELPGVNIDTSTYKKSSPEVSAEEPATPPPADETVAEATLPADAPSEPAPPPVIPPASDQASQDGELLQSIKGQLADMLDEDD